ESGRAAWGVLKANSRWGRRGARLARNVRAQPPPAHGRGGPIPVPPARAACKPRDRRAEKRGGSCHKRKDHCCTASLADVVARLRDDGVDAPLSVRPCQARLGGGECDEIVAVVRRVRHWSAECGRPQTGHIRYWCSGAVAPRGTVGR